MGPFVAVLVILVFFAIVLYNVVTNLIYVASTNEALVFAGANNKYVIVKGGRRLRRPLLETVHRMDLTLISIDVSVTGAFSKGGIPLDVSGVANVKIAGKSPELDRAIQRFLGLSRRQIENVAKDTLEGALRGIVAKMTPVELNENKVKFERELEAEARETLSLLGLTLDNLKIQAVSDRVNYLSAIGDKEKAALFQRARIAEAQNRGEASIKGSENRRVAEIASLSAEISKLEAESKRRVTNAVTAGEAMIAEEQGKVRAAVARARADVEVQKARIEQVRLKLQADMIQPAEAQMQASIRDAQGNAASIAEEGRALAEGLKDLVVQWKKAGPAAREIIIMQKVDKILEILLSSVNGVDINRYAMFGNSDSNGGGQSNNGAEFSNSLMKTVEQLKSGTGFDLAGGLAQLTGQSAGASGKSKGPSNKAAAKQVRQAESALAEAQKLRVTAQQELQKAEKIKRSAEQAILFANDTSSQTAPLPSHTPLPAGERPKLSVKKRSDVERNPARARLLTKPRR